MKKSSPYFRPLERAIKIALTDTPVVCILGPRQCGKSTLAQTFSSKRPYISFDKASFVETALNDPSGFVEALPKSVILDEIQRVPMLLRSLKASVDNDRRPGRFLLTGSANLLLLPQLSDSLAGRMEIIQLHPLSEAEKERKPGLFLDSLLNQKLKPEIVGENKSYSLTLQERLIAGGYPEPLTRAPERARQWHRNYLKSIIERDVHDIANIKNTHDLTLLLEMLSFRTGELLNISNLSNDLKLHRLTVDHYFNILERLFLIRRLPAWHSNESRRLIKTPKIHFLDTGLAASLSRLQVSDWLSKRERFGHLLESFVVQQLIAQSGWTNPDVRFWHYRDRDQVEVDLVITLGSEVWGIEVKASASVNHNDGKGLRRLADQCGKKFQKGIIFYTGNSTLPMADKRFLAVPLSKLWMM